MKIAIVGTGAMGSVYAGLFAKAGHEVWAIDTWQAHIDAIRTTGLRVTGFSGDYLATDIKVGTRTADAGPCDLYIVATKASGVADVAPLIAPCLTPDSMVLTVQNGLGSGERIARHLPEQNVLIGVAEGFGASMRGPGVVHHTGMRLIRLGELHGGMTERLQALETLWRDSGFNAQAFADIDQMIWEKFLCNVTLSAPCAAFDCSIGELMSTPDRWAVALGCIREAYALGRAQQIPFSFDDPERYVTEFASTITDASPSMRLDHLARRHSEIDEINGQVVELGRELGIPTPYNETLCAVIRAREATFA